MESYKVWLGDGSALDGACFDTFDEAEQAIVNRYGWDEVATVEACDGEWYLYATEDDADADQDGAFAPSVTRVEEVL
jgi:hypothetical protein